MKRTVLLFFALVEFFGYSQNENPINYFYAQFVGESVALNFELRQGAVCFGIQIERREENSEFVLIGVISGICGSEDSPESYVFNDDSPPKNKRVFYRLIFNGIGQSHEVEVFFPDFEQDDYVVAKEPNSQQWAVFYRNPLEQNIDFSLYTMSGALVYHAISQTNFVLLPTHLFQDEILFFFLRGETEGYRVSGKIKISP